jgi:hypothetical protein
MLKILRCGSEQFARGTHTRAYVIRTRPHTPAGTPERSQDPTTRAPGSIAQAKMELDRVPAELDAIRTVDPDRGRHARPQQRRDRHRRDGRDAAAHLARSSDHVPRGRPRPARVGRPRGGRGSSSKISSRTRCGFRTRHGAVQRADLGRAGMRRLQRHRLRSGLDARVAGSASSSGHVDRSGAPSWPRSAASVSCWP